MRKLTATICLTLAVLLGSAGMSWSTEPVKGYCLSETKHSHSPVSGQCSAAYESGNYTTALREWKPLAIPPPWAVSSHDTGNPYAQYNLGQLYRRGQGVQQDYMTAVKWYRLAAEQGYAPAQYNMGVMYQHGSGVPQDYKTTVKWYRLAANQGYASAQYLLGLSHQIGVGGLPQDYKEAARWYRQGAEQGHAGAQSRLGQLYEDGEGVPQDDKEAVRWYRLAAEQGDADAQKSMNNLQKKVDEQKHKLQNYKHVRNKGTLMPSTI